MTELERDYVRAPSGLIMPEWAAEERYAPISLTTGIDLFCGCGGFSLGMIQAGFEIVAAVEWDLSAACTYMCNLCRYGEYQMFFVEDSDRDRLEDYLEKQMRKQKGKLMMPHVAGSGWIKDEPRSVRGCSAFFLGDITKLTGEIILESIGKKQGDVGVVVGGPPCQGFSISGKKDVNDPRNNLVFEFIRLALEIHPKSICMENVPNIVNMTTPDGLPILDVVARALEDGSFATVEMLRKAISLQTGNVGIMRGGKRLERSRNQHNGHKNKPVAKPKRSRNPLVSKWLRKCRRIS